MEKRIRAKRIESVPSHAESPEPQTYSTAAVGSSPRQPAGQLSGWSLIIFLALMFVFFVLPMCSGGSHSNKTDGVFESATKKIDSGRADQLTPKEAQRIDDIINWCKICNKPLRDCPHGK